MGKTKQKKKKTNAKIVLKTRYERGKEGRRKMIKERKKKKRLVVRTKEYKKRINQFDSK